MRLNELTNDKLTRKNRKRVGRGIGSGTGKTSGAGHKGQKARAGASVNGFEGGQMPIYRRVPKRGFFNPFSTRYVAVNTSSLQRLIDSKSIDAKKTITKEVLAEAGVLKKASLLVKLLNKGEIKTAIKIEVDGASASAVEAVKKAGGDVKILGGEAKAEAPKKAAKKEDK